MGMRSVAVVTTVTSQSEDPGVKCLCGPGASIVLPVFCVVLSSFLPQLWHAFGGEVNWLLTSGVKDSACWLWQSLSNLVWCRCSVSPPADQTSVIRKRDARTFNNRSFSLSLWVVSVRGSVCVHGWIICQLREEFILIIHPLLLYYVSVWDHRMHRIRKKTNLPSDKP